MGPMRIKRMRWISAISGAVRGAVRGGPRKALRGIYDRARWKSRGVDLASETNEEIGVLASVGTRHDSSGGPDLRSAFIQCGLHGEVNSVLDIGSGKGGALIIFHELGLKRIAGVELSDRLVKICDGNMTKMNIDAEIFNCNALEFTHFDDYELIYMNNPLPVPALRSFLDNLMCFVERTRQRTRILFRHPPDESVFQDPHYRILKALDLNNRYLLIDVLPQGVQHAGQTQT